MCGWQRTVLQWGENVMQLHSERGVLSCIRALEDITPCVAASPQPVSELCGGHWPIQKHRETATMAKISGEPVRASSRNRCATFFRKRFDALFTTAEFDYPPLPNHPIPRLLTRLRCLAPFKRPASTLSTMAWR